MQTPRRKILCDYAPGSCEAEGQRLLAADIRAGVAELQRLDRELRAALLLPQPILDGRHRPSRTTFARRG